MLGRGGTGLSLVGSSWRKTCSGVSDKGKVVDVAAWLEWGRVEILVQNGIRDGMRGRAAGQW